MWWRSIGKALVAFTIYLGVTCHHLRHRERVSVSQQELCWSCLKRFRLRVLRTEDCSETVLWQVSSCRLSVNGSSQRLLQFGKM
ncbi:hypothetical protein K431DRAFT_130569 [Polychaeton citri CBS 116435]|uniref:Uncharacterized protein n=1 Tax=Polychaeton citri CBS 116435 TaxID=1314669 RepID=A0A9P4QFE6_9PEZI|nr:hypothetical protein K431DRAFT_130569 [Polychaeton citri CBS 116435]